MDAEAIVFLQKWMKPAVTLIGDPQKAEYICHMAYRLTRGKRLRNAEVFKILRKLAHEEKQIVPSTSRIMERIFGSQADIYQVNEISVEELLRILTPSIQTLDLLNGIIVALNVLGWENPLPDTYRHEPIALLLNELLAPMPDILREVDSMADAERALDLFRKTFCSTVSEIDKHGDWLCEVARKREDMELRCQAFLIIRELCTARAEIRFARNDGRYSLLRDRWNNHKAVLRITLETQLRTSGCVLE